MQMIGRKTSLMRFGAALFGAAMLVSTIVDAGPADALPAASAPFFMAGAQCSDEGVGYVSWIVRNTSPLAHDVIISVDGYEVVGPVTVNAGKKASGTFSYAANASSIKPVTAGWVDGAPDDVATLLMHVTLCARGKPRGPWFIAGQYCKNGKNKVRFKLVNSAPNPMPMNVTVSNKNNQATKRIWPTSTQSKVLESGTKITKNRMIPGMYGPGDEVRVRAWWLIGDPSAHNRVGFTLRDCTAP
jgi:hypothetical protein